MQPALCDLCGKGGKGALHKRGGLALCARCSGIFGGLEGARYEEDDVGSLGGLAVSPPAGDEACSQPPEGRPSERSTLAAEKRCSNRPTLRVPGPHLDEIVRALDGPYAPPDSAKRPERSRSAWVGAALLASLAFVMWRGGARAPSLSPDTVVAAAPAPATEPVKPTAAPAPPPVETAKATIRKPAPPIPARPRRPDVAHRTRTIEAPAAKDAGADETSPETVPERGAPPAMPDFGGRE
jgi:hypothetical protein